MEKVKEMERTKFSEAIKFVMLVVSFVVVAILSQVGEAATKKSSAQAVPALETLEQQVLTLKSPKTFKYERITLDSPREINKSMKNTFRELGISTRPQKSLCVTELANKKSKRSRHLGNQVRQLEAQLELNYLVDHLMTAETPRRLSDRQKALVAKLPSCKTYLGRLRAVARLLQNYKVVKN